MKLPKLLILLVILSVILAIFFLNKTPKFDEVKAPVESPSSNPESRYIEYNQNTFDKLSDKRRVLFFYASWCPICRPADTDFAANSSMIPEDTIIIKVNYNDSETDAAEKALAKKYGVLYQHTFVQIDPNGNEITKWYGGKLEKLLENIKSSSVLKRASFFIYTNGVRRIFTAPMYHNLSDEVFIEASEPSTIKIKKSGITWNDFFTTLPFKLTHACLTTGTNETFCSGNKGTLRFYLNGTQLEKALNLEIQEGDKLLVTFGDGSGDKILQQIHNF